MPKTTILKTEKKYLTGDFHCKYNGVLLKEFDSSGEALYSLEPYDYEILEAEPCTPERPVERQTGQSHQFFGFSKVPIKLNSNDTSKFYKEDITDVYLYDIELLKVNKEDKQTFGTLKAKVHCALVRTTEVEVEYEEDPLINIGSAPYITQEGELVVEEKDTTNGRKRNSNFNSKESNFGCASAIGVLFAVSFGIWLLAVLITSWQFVLPIVGIIACYWLVLKIGSFLSALVSRLLPFVYLLFLAFIGYGFFSAFSDFEPVIKTREETESEIKEKTETKVATTTETDNQITPDTIISHFRVWQDYDNNQYEGSLQVLQTDFRKSTQYRLNQNENLATLQDWNNLYFFLSSHDQPKLKKIREMLDSIRTSDHLSESQFANVVVSCIQDIPYVLTHPYSCEQVSQMDGFSKSYHKSRNPCMPHVKFGLQAPVEYMANLKADCDTRTLLLFSVLSSFGYDVIILGSTVYGHSVLGVNIPTTGSFKVFHGKKYYVWETTAKGLQLGQIAPEQKNMNNWQVMLTNSNDNLAL